jgi:hypothetical protein
MTIRGNVIPLEDIAEEVTRIVCFRQEACGAGVENARRHAKRMRRPKPPHVPDVCPLL